MENNKIKIKNYKHIKMIGVIVVLALNSFILGNINKHSDVKAMDNDNKKTLNVTHKETSTDDFLELKTTRIKTIKDLEDALNSTKAKEINCVVDHDLLTELNKLVKKANRNEKIRSDQGICKDFIQKTSSFKKYFNDLNATIKEIETKINEEKELENSTELNKINEEKLVNFQKQYLRFEVRVKGMGVAVLSYFNSLINSYINSNKKDLEDPESLASALNDKLNELNGKGKKYDLKALKEELITPFFENKVKDNVKVKGFFTKFNETVKNLEKFIAESARKRRELLSGGNNGSIKGKIDALKDAYKNLAGVKNGIVSCVEEYLKNFSELE